MLHCHNHSHYSTLDGLSKIDEIIEKTKKIGVKSVVITDHASISSMPELFKKAHEANLNPIIGCEFYLTDSTDGIKGEKRYHLNVLAKNWLGVESIMRQLTLANDQFYHRPRLSFEQSLDFENCIISTACCIGILAHNEYEAKVAAYRAMYGDDFYLEIMPHIVKDKDGIDLQEIVNIRALRLSKEYSIKLLATNDCHYVEQKDGDTQKALLALQYHKRLEEMEIDGNPYYMRSIDEMVAAFHKNCPYVSSVEFVNALKTTTEIEGKCNIEMPKFEVFLPQIYEDEDSVAIQLILDGWNTKVSGIVPIAKQPEYMERVQYEISVIQGLGFMRYFLIVQDIIKFATESDIMTGSARGSSAGSLVCYLMGITRVDPMKFGLYFERFLNPERIDLPDIDMDFEDGRRQEVFDYIFNKYGTDKTARINTFGKMLCNGAFRDVARLYGIMPLKINDLSKQIEGPESFDTVPDLISFGKKHPEIVALAKSLNGTIRQVGVHACGICVSQYPLSKVSAVERRKDSSGVPLKVINWDKTECENFGLLKFDVLGLTTLSILNRALHLIKDNKGIDIDLDAIKLDDTKTIRQFDLGNCAGVFQFEGAGMQNILKSIPVNDFETITAITALYRPGSLESGQTTKYINIKAGNEYESYEIPELEPILKETAGTIVYQEQVMRIFAELGGFSWAHADKMRKIIGKKLGEEEFNKHKVDFIAGCDRNKINTIAADDLFERMSKFASYAFNKAHAVSYTIISFWAMYLKVHYPVEFLAGYMNHVKDANDMVKEIDRLKIKLRLPDVNLSTDKYEVSKGELIAPLTAIKGVGSKAVSSIIEARKSGKFVNLDDLKARVNRRVVNVRVIKLMEDAGAFEKSFGMTNANTEAGDKSKSELMAIFSKMPKLTLEGRCDTVAYSQFAREFKMCGKLVHNTLMLPVFDGTEYNIPPIMVINSSQKNEQKHLKANGTKHFMDVAESIGFKKSDFYYTGTTKCFFESGVIPSNECATKCQDFLIQEIKAVRPKLIMCCNSSLIQTLSGKKATMGKMNGNVIYNKEYDAYVLFSHSPQYAYYQPDKAGDSFVTNMEILKNIFSNN